MMSMREASDTPVTRRGLMRGGFSLSMILSIVCSLTAGMAGGLWAATMPGPPTQAASASTDDAEMVYIPEGDFLRGHDEGFDTRPARRISLPAFFIDTYEVTNKRYKRFVDATGHKVPWSPDPAAEAYPWPSDPAARAYTWDWHTRTYAEGKGENPVVLVGWEDAAAFCAWAGKALPTEAEWEKAARGTSGKIYPWGNVWDPRRANTLESGLRATTPVGAVEGDVSEYGVHDLAGNVSEWVQDWLTPYPGNSLVNYDAGQKYKVLRGGSWDYFHSITTGYHRQYALPQSQMTAIGFRCAKPGGSSGSRP